jgi:ribosome-associated toxin RatA of RatAB toxin-antitoxin module
MTTFQSTVTIPQPANKIFDFLADMNNHQKLMPAEDIGDWKSTYNEASFNIKGMINLSLKVDNRVENKEIRIVPAEKPPFELELKWELSSTGNQTEVTFTITAELNLMMKMAVSGQLKKLTEHETNSLILLIS